MSDIALRVKDLGKCYRIGVREQGYKTFREALVGAVLAPARNLSRLRSLTKFSSDDGPADDIIWALKDVNFDVKQGEVVGVIGANGAGKSTLLKILSRITEPSTGRVQIKGRVSSLLEVGTGFHPELTGRENVYLNAAVLGMRRAEIDRKFAEIVDFSGVEKFIDTPVKRYSSGMQVRLAFAVAAQLEPEILIVDEVLAVGDAEFQKKCLGKMGEVAKQGRTVLFVSHNMAAINTLCDRAIVLKNGLISFEGETELAIRHHLESPGNVFDRTASAHFKSNPALPIQIRGIRIENKEGENLNIINYQETCCFKVHVDIRKTYKDYYAYVSVHDSYGNLVLFTADDDLDESKLLSLDAGSYKYALSLPSKLLRPGEYLVTFSLNRQNKGRQDSARLSFEIQDNRSRRGVKGTYRPAVVAPEIPWIIEQGAKEKV